MDEEYPLPLNRLLEKTANFYEASKRDMVMLYIIHDLNSIANISSPSKMDLEGQVKIEDLHASYLENLNVSTEIEELALAIYRLDQVKFCIKTDEATNDIQPDQEGIKHIKEACKLTSGKKLPSDLRQILLDMFRFCSNYDEVVMFRESSGISCSPYQIDQDMVMKSYLESNNLLVSIRELRP